MTMFGILTSAATGSMLVFAALIVMVLAAGLCFGIAAHAVAEQHNERVYEVSRLGHCALVALETARADILRLGDKLHAAEALGSGTLVDCGLHERRGASGIALVTSG